MNHEKSRHSQHRSLQTQADDQEIQGTLRVGVNAEIDDSSMPLTRAQKH
jgi:hypothetical protein